VWIISQVFIITFSFYSTREIIFIQNFNVIAGNIIAQLFGTSLLEEMIFRGILLIQLYLIFIAKYSNKITIIYSLAASAIIFVLFHIPNRILTYTPDNLAIDTMSLLFGSTLLGIIFLKTKNLPFVIGFHSLVNDPSNIIVTNIPTEPIIFALVIIITLKWDKIIGKETEYLLPTVEPQKV
jgi:membrane protease YdiL (CAAX protease family)